MSAVVHITNPLHTPDPVPPRRSVRPLRIALIASARYAVDSPFAGGLESQTWSLAQGLKRRGHDVTLFASGADATLRVSQHDSARLTLSDAARADVSMTAEDWVEDHHAYLEFMISLAHPSGQAFDVVHNNSIHYLPIAMASAVPVPMVTTLHTPPTPWLESAIQIGPCPVTFVAVSTHTGRAWEHIVSSQVIHNGVDLDRWTPGPGGGPAIWFGRVVPEKGPHLAIAAAKRAGLSLDVVGPRYDQEFFASAIEPELGDGIRYLGHLDHDELADRVGRASVSLVTPCWEEPYGLVAAESLACGTPVAGFARGGVPEIVDAGSGVLVAADDVAALADAAVAAIGLDRGSARARAEAFCSVEHMLDGYELLYQSLAGSAAA